MQTPGAAMSMSWPKFEKNAIVSSIALKQSGSGGAPPPGCPLLSAMAETVMTSSYARIVRSE